MSPLLKHHERERLIWDSTLSGNEKLLTLALNSFVDGNGECFPGQETLAQMCGLKVRSIRNLCKSLELKGVLARTHRYGKDGNRTSDKYRLSFQVLAAKFSCTGESRISELPANITSSPLPANEGLAANFACTDELRISELPANNASSPLPANDDATTGNSRPDYRQMTTPLPATDSGDLSRGTIQKNYPEKNYPVSSSSQPDFADAQTEPVANAPDAEPPIEILATPVPHQNTFVAQRSGLEGGSVPGGEPDVHWEMPPVGTGELELSAWHYPWGIGLSAPDPGFLEFLARGHLTRTAKKGDPPATVHTAKRWLRKARKDRVRLEDAFDHWEEYQDWLNGVTPQNEGEQSFQDIMAATFGDVAMSEFERQQQAIREAIA
ncbi:MAG: helix-turn-helix domain-containing protein [Cyanobacteria bacterium J06639_14]